MLKIEEIYEFTKNNDQTPEKLRNHITEKTGGKPSYIRSIISNYLRGNILLTKDGYIFVNDTLIKGLNKL